MGEISPAEPGVFIVFMALKLLVISSIFPLFSSSISNFKEERNRKRKIGRIKKCAPIALKGFCRNIKTEYGHCVFPLKDNTQCPYSFLYDYCSLKRTVLFSASMPSTIASDSKRYPKLRIIVPPCWKPFSIAIPIPATFAPAISVMEIKP